MFDIFRKLTPARVVRDELQETQLQALHHAKLSEYHAAMARMLEERKKRLLSSEFVGYFAQPTQPAEK